MKSKSLSVLLFLPILFLSLFSKTCHPERTNLEATIIQLVKAFEEKDQATINGMINQDIGLIVLFRRGVFDEYGITHKFDFDEPIPEYLPYFDFSTDYNLTFGGIPAFDCDTQKWSKYGLYCDTTLVDKLLSSTARNLKKHRGDKISEEEIKRFEELEKKSKRIVLCDPREGELIFYLTLINNQWFFTILDRVTTDCSA